MTWIALAALAASTVISAPAAHADDIYGLITADEAQEISANGWRVCQPLDATAPRPVTSDDAKAVVEGYIASGWDLESAGDIVWESVEGNCPEYLEPVKRAMRSYGPAH